MKPPVIDKLPVIRGFKDMLTCLMYGREPCGGRGVWKRVSLLREDQHIVSHSVRHFGNDIPRV
jgi:hypothetical protein